MSDTPATAPVSDQATSPSDTGASSENATSGKARSETTLSAAAARRRPPARRSRGASVLLTLILLLLIAGIGGLAWFQLEQRKTMVALQTEVAALLQRNTAGPDQLTALQQEQEQMLTRVQQTETSQQQLQAAVQQAIQQEQQSTAQAVRQSQQATEEALQASEQALQQANTFIAAQGERLDGLTRELVATNLRIRDSGAGASQAWMLSEAESLLRLARQRLLAARDVSSAIALFSAADDLLKQLNDPSVFAVREMLAQELATLQALPEVGVQDLYMQLGAQIERIGGFAVASESGGQDFTMPSVAENGVAETPGNWLDSVQDVLGRYFVVTQRDGTITPQLTDEQAYLTRRGIQLKIEQARLALLRGQAGVYQRALDEAINGIATRLQDEAGNKDSLVATLTTLRDTPITVDIPPLNATLSAIRQVTPAPADTPAEGD